MEIAAGDYVHIDVEGWVSKSYYMYLKLGASF